MNVCRTEWFLTTEFSWRLGPLSPLLQHGSGLRPEETTANTESLLEGSCFLRPDPVSEGNINLTVKKCESVSYCSRTQLYLNIPETEIIFGIQNSAIKVEKYSHTLYPAAFFLLLDWRGLIWRRWRLERWPVDKLHQVLSPPVLTVLLLQGIIHYMDLHPAQLKFSQLLTKNTKSFTIFFFTFTCLIFNHNRKTENGKC